MNKPAISAVLGALTFGTLVTHTTIARADETAEAASNHLLVEARAICGASDDQGARPGGIKARSKHGVVD